MNFPDMTINEVEVKHETQVQALKLFLQNQSRQAKHLGTFLEDLGVPVYRGTNKHKGLVSMRAADRLLQKARKAGIITFNKGRWDDGHSAQAFLQA